MFGGRDMFFVSFYLNLIKKKIKFVMLRPKIELLGNFTNEINEPSNCISKQNR